MIGLLSLLAEKYPRLGGLLISMPTTLPLGLFFIGWSSGRESAKAAASMVPLSLALLLIFAMIFIGVAQANSRRRQQLLWANLLALGTWLVLALVITTWPFPDRRWGILIYLLCFGLAASQLGVTPAATPSRASHANIHLGPLLVRAIFGGSVIALCVILTRLLSPLWGGLFATFPAVYLSTLNIITFSQGAAMLDTIGRTIPLGTLFLLGYALLAAYFLHFGLLSGLGLAYIIILLAMFTTTKMPWFKIREHEHES